MNPEDIKLENELNELLDQAGAGDFEAQKNSALSPLLQAAKNFTQAELRARAKSSFAKILRQLPSSAPTTPKTKLSFINFITMATNRLRFVRPFGTALAVLFLLVGGINFYRVYSGQTPAGRSVAQITSSLSGGGAPSGGTFAADSSIGAATGLGAPSEGIVERAKNALGFDGGTYNMAEPSIAPMPPEYYPYPQIQTVPGSDTREYNKTSYYASVKSRQANELAEQIQTMIRGWGGRIDNSSISDKNSYLSFVIPKSNLEQLRTELKSSAGVKFVTENISSQNLLPQKVSIEKQTGQTTESLAELMAARDEFTKQHNATLASLNKQLAAKEVELRNLENAKIIDYITPEESAAHEARKAEVRRQIASLKSQIAAENSNYEKKLNSYNTQIKNREKNLENLAEQDTNLEADVETVQGSLSFTRIGIFEVLNIFINGYLPALIWVVIGGALLYVVRRPRRADIEPVQ